jgi:hypothetical protein
MLKLSSFEVLEKRRLFLSFQNLDPLQSGEETKYS